MIKFPNDEYSSEELAESLGKILDNNELLSMSTISEGGNAYINTAYFSYIMDDGLSLYILTNPKTQHSVNLEESDSVAITVFESNQKFGTKLQGVQLFGKGRRVLDDSDEIKPAFSNYSRRFMKALEWVPKAEDFTRNLIESKIYVLEIDRVKIFDEKKFGKDVWIDAEIFKS